ncbi:hypothetical protein BT96DRAFT_627801 [Gymnopus androsaceus JB14]|uniref:DUF6534 domain-containing protein n=1 Tax=Gymnopus androsaceus JB14 TaxID=1447944 RepID=A0A6A4IEE1_9AGAR|nr:hypothetical protein BT96DRAFT_627801 [Gymnopus androsaceus JB14]
MSINFTMSGLSPAEQAQINILLGGVIVSNCLSYLTMGIVLSAAWIYFSKFPYDTWWFKALVILCVSMCIADTIGTGIWTYDWGVANYGNPAVMALMPWVLPAEVILMGSCGLTVQLFYAWRVWMMSVRKNWILPVDDRMPLHIRLVYPLLDGTHLQQHTSSCPIQMRLLYLRYTYGWGAPVGADVLITSSMIYYLDLRFRIKRHKTQQNQANYHAPRRFRRLIVRTVECNFLSLFVQAVGVGLFNCSNVGLYFVTNMTLAKVYTFSLLVSCIPHSHSTRLSSY